MDFNGSLLFNIIGLNYFNLFFQIGIFQITEYNWIGQNGQKSTLFCVDNHYSRTAF